MKKLRILALIGALICLLGSFFGCGGNALSKPTYLSIDLEDRLVWSDIEGARGYELSIKDVDSGEVKSKKSNRPYILISALELEQGDYEIRIKALGNRKDKKDSAWSKIFYFEKEYESGCIYALVNNLEYEITRVGKASGEFTIKGEYRDKPVVRIADNAFKSSSSVEKITIENNIEEIGNSAFFKCTRLESIVLPETLTSIGESAFYYCSSLQSIAIPEGITAINDYTFEYCAALEEVDLPESLVTIGINAFSKCSKLTEVNIPDKVETVGDNAFSGNTELTDVVIGKSVKTIGANAFDFNSKLKKVQFGEEDKEDSSLETIGLEAFAECTALESIDLPESLVTIEDSAFMNCTALTRVGFPDTLLRIGTDAFAGAKFFTEAVAAYDAAAESSNAEAMAKYKYVYMDDWLLCANGKDDITEITRTTLLDTTVGIADSVFKECNALKKVALPAKVRAIGAHAFEKCTALWELKTTEKSVKVIGDYAFSECNMRSVSIGEGLEEIGAFAFAKCSGLRGMSLPSTVKRIGADAYKDTELWKNAEEGVVYAGNWVVGYIGKDATVNLKDKTVGISEYAFYKNSEIVQVKNLHKVKYIGRAAFYECTKLGNVSLNNSLSRIEDYTFYKCSSLLIVNAPVALEYIGRSAFYKCEKLSSIDLTGAVVKTIGDNAFYNCLNLKTVNLGKKLQSVGSMAFYNASSVETLALPDSLETVKTRAFGSMKALQSLTIGSGVTELPEFAFAGCESLKELVLPGTLEKIGRSAFYNCGELEKLTIEEGVKEIGMYAFYGIEKVQALSFPSSLRVIGNYAFKGAKEVTTITLSKDLEYVGAHAFYGSKGTFYTDAISKEVGWNSRFNSSFRPMVWGATMETENDYDYVFSVKIQSDLIVNLKADGGFTAPKREGYTFGGWTTQRGGKTAEYQESELIKAPIDTVLYAIWNPVVVE